MGSKELIESIKKSAAERLAAMRADAEADALKIREEAERRIELIRSHYKLLLETEAEAGTAEVTASARVHAGRILLDAERKIEKRCFKAAVSNLYRLRDEGYAEVFGRLASEIPRHEWKRVRVNPDDIGIAADHFPGAEIIADTAISGGMDASTESEDIRVINSFEKRLETAWDELFPEIMKAIHETEGIGTP